MKLENVIHRALRSAGHSEKPADLGSNFDGKWINELQSEMNLSVANSQVTGTYISAVSDGGDPVKGDLSGYVNGDQIAFVVNWCSNAAITAWVGHLVIEENQAVIETLWQMTTKLPDKDDPDELWEFVFAGADRFHR